MNTTLFYYMERIYPLTDEIKLALLENAKRETFSKHQSIFKPGAINTNLYFIEKGLVRIYYYEEEKEFTDYFLKEGDLLALVESYYFKTPSEDGAEAIEETTVLSLPFETLDHLYDKYHILERNSRLTVMLYGFYWRKRYRTVMHNKVSERYIQLLETSPEIIQRVPLHYIAEYLNTTAEHLSRIRKER